jgi:hypothetical protein
VLAQGAAQAAGPDIDRALVDHVAVLAEIGDQRGAAKHPVGVGNEEGQQAEFVGPQWQHLAAKTHREGHRIDDQLAVAVAGLARQGVIGRGRRMVAHEQAV